MCDPSVEERLERLNKALGIAVKLLLATPAVWENECEGTFGDFRRACVHLRKEQEALDTIEDKVSAWRFVCNFMKARPFMYDRGNEVIRILMKSDQWMQAFQDTGLSLDDLPPDVKRDFKERAEEAIPDYPIGGDSPDRPGGKHAGGDPAAKGGGDGPGKSEIVTPMRPANMAVVVQRCSRAKVLLEERAGWWDEIGQGLVISVSFSKGAKEDCVVHAARFILTAKLSTKDRWQPGAKRVSSSEGGGAADSLVALCAAGDEQGLLVLPQESLCSEVEKDNVGLQYGHAAPQAAAHELYKAFVNTLKSMSAELSGNSDKAKQLKVLSASFHGHQYFEMTTSGPFTHAFNF